MSGPSPVPDAAVTDRYPAGHILPLAYGPWRAELRGDELADISFDGVSLLRAVRPVVRDEDWNTIPVRVLGQTANDSTLTTELVFESPGGSGGVPPGASPAPGIAYKVTLTITLTTDALAVHFAGRALTAFRRNRIGLVVLHLADDAGRPVEVVQTDGSVSGARWPRDISPHQPFRDVAGFRWTTDGVRAELDLAGDVFETEDQRNWTDYSFKTYSTPLSLPFPVGVEDGDVVTQRVHLRVSGQRSTPLVPTGPHRVVVTDEVVATVPGLGLTAFVFPGRAPGRATASAGAGFASVLLELSGPQADWPRQVESASVQAAGLQAGLDVRLVTGEPEAIARGLDLLDASPVVRLSVFDPSTHVTSAELWSRLLIEARRRKLRAELVAGTRAHFTELNRQLDHLPTDASALTFSITPQMHASELAHIIDSLAGQRLVAQNALRLSAGRPVHVGPVTLARRFNAVATGVRPHPAAEASQAVDGLQPTEFTAAWTLASVAALTVPGIASLTYFETSGPRGICAEDGAAYPVARVLDWIAGAAGQPVLFSFAPPGIFAYPVRRSARLELAVANLTADAVELDLEVLARTRSVRIPAWSVRLVFLP